MRYYHMLSVLCTLATTLLCGLATPFTTRWGDVHVKHSWISVPDDWMDLGHPAADTTIDLHIALKPQNENALIDSLNEVSSPDHPKYGEHLSKEQVSELVAPPTEVLDLVNAWLKHHRVRPSSISTKHGGSWLTLIGMPVSRANDLLEASYQLYHHIETNTTVLRTLSYGLPGGLLEHVQTVVPTTHFDFPHTSLQNPLIRQGGEAVARSKEAAGELRTGLSSREELVTPAILRSLYRTSSYVPTAAKYNALGVLGLLGDSPDPDDLRIFMNDYRSDATSATYLVAPVNGGVYDPSNPAMESNVNIQYAEAMAFPATHIFYSVGTTLGDPLINWLNYMLDRVLVPQTISSSYGKDEYTIPPDHAIWVCNLFARLAARGASVLFASGDAGVGRGNCRFQDGHVRFLPTFPSTCPWVTSVGGTTGSDPEVAARISGGGFSVYFPRPPYQDRGVPTFLQNLGSQFYGLYNAGGRGVPDIALQARDFEYIFNGQRRIASGTSCAAPAAAGIISLLNDYRISNGRRPLGFLNPWLYGGGLAGLNDITRGSNPGCNTPGFAAMPGWDPVTGLGTLDFVNLLEILRYGW
ncbi:subtilisin-like protein [Lactarius quietus]|nr:subtilisin-like protein [Lactarius quietus]